MLAIRNSLCSGRWQADWPRIETRLRKQTQQRRRQVNRLLHPTPPTTRVGRALLLGNFGPDSIQPSVQESPPSQTKEKSLACYRSRENSLPTQSSKNLDHTHAATRRSVNVILSLICYNECDR